MDPDAIAFNMESMRRNIDQKTGMIGVIKTDAYGHGSVPVAEAIEDYVDGYAVATADEAMLLRRNDIRKMILILGVTHPSRYQELIEEEIRPGHLYDGTGKTAVRHGGETEENRKDPSGSGYRHAPYWYGG